MRIPTLIQALVAIGLSLGLGTVTLAAIPTTQFYPFPGYDLGKVRAKTQAESTPNSPELNEAWRLYSELQGSWRPGAPKPKAETLNRFNRLKETLEAAPRPVWFSVEFDAGKSGPGRVPLAEKIGDEAFEQQRATPQYQTQKALAIVYLTAHELDRPGASQMAGRYLSVLVATHPWDWQVHNLFGRFLVEAQLPAPGWQAAKQGLFLNPDPTVDDLKFFAFMGLLAKGNWPAIQEAIRQAALDDRVAELAIVDSAKLFGGKVKVLTMPPKVN